ncbi:MAG: sigma-54-dependent transcriptional regulator [Acidobacteriota bacterium]
MDRPVSIVLVDDDAELCELVRFGLAPQGITVASRTSGEEAFALVTSSDVDVVVTDLAMPGMHGFELIDRIAANRPELPVIVLTGAGDFATAVTAMRTGAYDFVTKPVDLAALALAVRRAAERRALRAEVSRLRRVVAEARRFGNLVGASAAMQQVYDVIEQVGPTDATVLITGQSGTGKEIVARSLHHASKRRAGPFVAVDCAAIPENLIESELFGHVRGAYTDAKLPRQGLLVQASGGTLFLDEIADLPVSVQPKLLRVLQERRVRPVGGDSEQAFDVRLVCATNRDLEAMVQQREFREDLYYRINVVQVPLPPLRVRAGDVLLLAQHFVDHFARMFDREISGLTAEAAERLQRYGWPGNVRELRNAIERAVAMSPGPLLQVEDLPERIRDYRGVPARATHHPELELPLEEIERRHILRVLEANQGNKLAASQVLGIDRKTLYRKLMRYGVDRES